MAGLHPRLEQLEIRQVLASGAGLLDSTFNLTGKITTDFNNTAQDHVQAVAIQSDGSVVVAGTGDGGKLALARYDSNGVLDASFGSGGKASIAIGSTTFAQANSLYILGDGSILVGGYALNGAAGNDFLVAKLTPTGNLDASFGVGATGYTLTDIGTNSSDIAYALAVRTDGSGQIILGGSTLSTPTSNGMNSALVEYSSGGVPVASFGSSGKLATNLSAGTNDDRINSLIIQSDQKIVVAGQADGNFVLARYNADGSGLDSSFGGTGKVFKDFGGNDGATGLALLPSGSLIVGGFGNGDFGVARYSGGGLLDTSFGASSGFTLTNISGTDAASALAIAPDGKIVLAGTTNVGSSSDIAVVRYKADGILDTAFGTGGVATNDFGDSDVGNAVAVQANRKIVVAGYTTAGSNPDDFAVVRLQGNTTPTLGNASVAVLPAIDEDIADVSNTGMSVHDLIAAADVNDADGDAKGIAVTQVNNAADGNWQYSTNSGSNWTAFGSPSATVARLLADNPGNRVRFVPNLNFNGTATFSFVAWDQVIGVDGGVGNPIASTADLTNSFSTGAPGTAALTINPVNDPAVITGDTTGSVTEDVTLAANGNLTATDPDAGESSFQASGSSTTHGSYTIDAAGAWVYSLNNADANVQALGASGTLSDSFTVHSVDGTAQLVSIVIHGTNDPALITGDTTGTVTEDGALTANGNLTATDIDTGESSFQAAANPTTHGSFSIDAAGVWSYSLNNTDPAVQALAAGGTLADSFTVHSVDGTAQLVSITIHGTNDPALITGDTSGNVTEDTTLTANGNLTATDTDTGESAFQSDANSTTHGSFTIDAAGAWVYTLNNADASVQALGAAGTLSDSFTVQSIDGTTQLVSITIHGANDVALITGDTAGDVTEDITLTASGTLTATDTDSGESAFQTDANSTTHGSFSIDTAGAWSYLLNNADPAVQALAAGGTLADSFTVHSIDGTAQIVSITIHGTNESPAADVFVDDVWTINFDADGSGGSAPTFGDTVQAPEGGGFHTFGIDAFSSIQAGVNAVTIGGTVHVYAGSYAENVTISKSLTLEGAEAGQNADSRFGAFVGGKADPSVETVLTAPANNPLGGNPGANDLIRVLADGITIDGLVIDGNNPILGSSSVVDHGVDIHARRGITNIGADDSFHPVNDLLIENNIIQNISQRGISLANNGPVSTGNLITGNVITGYGSDPVNGGQAIILFTNAYSDITNNSIIDTNGQIGLHLQNFFSNGTMTWSGNHITVSQDGIGIHANLFYAPAGVLNITGNTINAAAGVIGSSDLTWGINIWSVQVGSTVNLSGNTIGSTGGQLARGINLWNLPTANTVTVSSGSIANSIVGINVDNVDPYFGGGSDTSVNISGVTVTGGDVGVRVRASQLPTDPFYAANSVTGNVHATLSGVTISGATTGVLADAPAAASPFSATVTVNGNSQISGGTTGIAVSGAQVSVIVSGNLGSIHDNVIGIDVSGGNATISGNHIYGNTTAGIRFTSGGHGSVDGNNFEGSVDNTTDVRLDSNAGTITFGNGNEFAADLYAIDNHSSQSLDLSATTGTTFNGVALSTATTDELYAIEDKVLDAVDVPSLGLVRLKAGQIYVTLNSFSATDGTTSPSIQRGIAAANSGDSIHVQAGTYKENINVNKSVSLLGANAGTAGDDIRGVETHLITNGNQNAVVTVSANNVTIDGFTIDGDDPSITGGMLFSGDDANVNYGVQAGGAFSGITLTNNVVERVAIGFRGDGLASGNEISRNWFDSIGNFDFGYAVSLRSDFYADVTDNLMTRVWTGIHTNNFHTTGGPATWTISGNEIHSYAGGLLYWLQYGSATALKFDNNQIFAETGAVANNAGIVMVSIQNSVNPIFTHNTITGTDYGVILTNVSTSNVVTLGSTDSIVGTHLAGVYLTDNLSFNTIGTTNLSETAGPYFDPIAVRISGASITGSLGVGVKVETSRTVNADMATTAIIDNNTTISGVGSTGIFVTGALASAIVQNNGGSIHGNDIGIDVSAGSATVSGNHLYGNTTGIRFTSGGHGSVDGNEFDGVTDNITDLRLEASAGAVTVGDTTANHFAGDQYYIDNGSTQNIDATNNTFDQTSNFRIEDRMHHKVDSLTLGLVTWVAGNLFVTNPTIDNPDASPSTDSSIQRDIDAANAGNTVNVEAGSYGESPHITKSLTLSGDGRDTTTINLLSADAPSGTYLSSLEISGQDVTVEGFTIVGNSAVGSGLANSNILLDPGLNSVSILNNRIKVGQIGAGSNGDDGMGILTTYTTTPGDFVITLDVTGNEFVPNGSDANRAFYINPGVTTFNFTGNTISGQFDGRSFTQATNSDIEENTITGSGAAGSRSAGIGVWGFPDAATFGHATIKNNDFSNLGKAISVLSANNVIIENNNFTNNDIGVLFDDSFNFGTLNIDYTTDVVRFNGFESSNTVGLQNGTSTTIDASQNWWGDAAGPRSPANTYVPNNPLGEAFVGDVTVVPWLNHGDANISLIGFQVTAGEPDTTGVTYSAPGSQSVAEGTPTSITLGSFADAVSATGEWHLAVNWGDGSPVEFFVAVSAGALAQNHTYADGPDSHTVSVQIADGSGNTDSGSFNVTVNNVAPTLSISGNSSVDEGATYTLNLSSSDPGADTIGQWTITWGDGSLPQTVAGNPSTATHVYVDGPNNWVISATATDEDGTFAAGNTVSVHVNDVAPTADLSQSATSVNEGSSYTLKIGNVIDPGPDTITGYTINWGDGNIDFFGSMASAPAASPANTQHTHTYADGPNLRTVNITVEDQDGFHTLTDPNGPSTSGSLDVTVVNVAPTATLQNFGDVNEGSANTVRFINQFDPSNSGPTNDTSSGFHYAYDFNNDGVYDLGGATPSYSSGITNAQVVVPSSFLLTPGSHTVRARIIDKDEGFTEYTTTFTVNNVAPVVSIPSTFNAGTGVPFDIGGSFTDAGNDTPWTGQVDYGDGAGFQSLTVNSANKTFTLSHTYATSGPKTITVKITDSFGAIGTATTNVAVTDTTLQVVNFVQNISGFDVQFNRAVQIGDVALYGIGHSFASPFTVLDHNNVPVNGSLIWDAVTNTAHWVKTGGVLSTDTYNVTLVSGATGNTFHGAGLSDALDGDANDTAGGNFVRSVSVTAPTTRVLSIPDFARGQGQSVKVNQHGVQPLGAPNVVDPNGGLPVYIDNGSGVKSVDFVLNYNPSLLTISTAATDLQVPANWVVQISDDLQGHLHVLVFSFDGSDLGAGQHTVITFKNVSVPAAAPYGAAELLTMSNLLLNENEVSPIPAVADAAVHKAADLGDTTGNGTVGGAADASFVAQVVVGNNTGFAAYPLTDPLIIGDVSGDGTLSGLDGSFIAQIFTNPGSQAQVPVEGGLNTPIAGVDPIIRTGLGQTTSIIGTRGQHLNATVDITDTGSGLFAADLIITYDTTRLDLSNAGVSLSAQLASAGWFLAKNVDDGAGTIRISTFSQDLPLGAGPVSLLNLDFTVPSTAPEGVSPLAILNPNGTQTNNSSRLNEGALVISTDLGTITIPPMKGDWNHDGQRTIDDIPAMLTALTDLNGYKVNRGLSDSDVLAIGDINNDGFITNRDIQAMLDLVAADQILGSGGGSSSEESAVPPPVSPSVVQTQNSMATDAGTLGQAQSSAFALSPETGVQVSIAAGSPQPLPVATLNSPSSDAADSSPASSALVDASNYKVGNTASIPAALFASSLTTFNVGGTAFDSGTSPAGMYGHGEASVPTLDSTAATDDFYAKLHEGKVASWEHCLLGEHPGSSDTSIDVAWEELLTDLADSRATVM